MVSRMRSLGRPFRIAVTATTRQRRQHETDGVDYFFLDHESFKEMLSASELLESAEVYGNMYGVPKSQIRQALESGIDVIVKTDVQGAATIRKLATDAVFVFLAPPGHERARAPTQAKDDGVRRCPQAKAGDRQVGDGRGGEVRPRGREPRGQT